MLGKIQLAAVKRVTESVRPCSFCHLSPPWGPHTVRPGFDTNISSSHDQLLGMPETKFLRLSLLLSDLYVSFPSRELSSSPWK